MASIRMRGRSRIPYVNDLPEFYQVGYPEGTAPLEIAQAFIDAKERKRQVARQEESDRMAKEDRDRQMAQADEDRALKVAQLQQTLAAMTDLTTQPQVEKQVTEGVNVSPEESAYMGGMVEPGFKPQEEVTTSVPDVPRSTSVSLAGQNVDIPLLYRQDLEAREQEKFDTGLGRDQIRQEALDFVDVPGVGRVNKALVPFFAAQARAQAADNSDARDLGDRIARIGPDGKVIWSLKKGLAPSSTPAGEKRRWVTNNKTKQREYATDEQIATADPGTYSDVRPTSTSVRKADPAKLKMAISGLGGPDVPGSLWALATEINTGKGTMAALGGVAKRKFTELAPELATHSTDPQVVKTRQYMRQLQGFASSIAKAFGESGVLTNQDIARATGLFPQPGESPETTQAALQRIQAVMGAGLTAEDFREIFGREPCSSKEAACPGGGDTGGAEPDAPDGSAERPIPLG